MPPPPVDGAPMGTGLEVTVGVTLTNGVGCTGTGGGDAGALADELAVGVLGSFAMA